MTCTACGDNPKNDREFPSAVVEINNPEQLVLLRKVVIPATMTEEDNPPAIGKYRNVILQYEDTGHIYLYSSDGIPTALESNVPQEVLDRIDDLESEDAVLHGEISSLADDLAGESQTRETADNALGVRIDSEIAARTDADNALGLRLNTVETNLATEAQTRAAADTAINEAIVAETSARQTADAGLQGQIDAITASSDVTDIVGTYAQLQTYDTSTLGNNDIIKVLQDESQNDETTYYRWSTTTQSFTLIGEEGPYYTKSQADVLFNAKQNTLTAGSNVQIINDTISATDTTYTAGNGLALNGTQFSVDTTTIATQSDLTAGLATKQDTLTAGANVQINNNTISATDTTYSPFTGTDGTTAGAAGLVPAPATTDAGKFLKADGTWDTAGGGSGPTVVQTTGTSTTDVMSQNAVTSMVFADPSTKYIIKIGSGTQGSSSAGVAIGSNSRGTGQYSIAIASSSGNSDSAEATSSGSIAIGRSSMAKHSNSIALGSGAKTSVAGEMNIGTSSVYSNQGYNGSNYRLLTGLYDPQSAHDAATKGYVDSVAPTITMTTTDPGEGATLAENTFIAVYNAS